MNDVINGYPLLFQIRDNEYVKRTMISDMGVKTTERIQLKSGKKNQVEEEEYECETCSANLYVSFVSTFESFVLVRLLMIYFDSVYFLYPTKNIEEVLQLPFYSSIRSTHVQCMKGLNITLQRTNLSTNYWFKYKTSNK